MNPLPSYRVTFNGQLLDRLRRLLTHAVSIGVGERVLAALAAVEQRLATDRRAWGDPYQHLRGMNATEYHRIYDQLLVMYAVHDSAPEVFVTRISPVLGQHLALLNPSAG